MVAIVISAVIAAAGLWLVIGQAGTDMEAFGWLLLVVGAASLVVNLVLRRRFGTPGRRR
jgi:drug/metabolite transporter (DMT)-like permease